MNDIIYDDNFKKLVEDMVNNMVNNMVGGDQHISVTMQYDDTKNTLDNIMNEIIRKPIDAKMAVDPGKAEVKAEVTEVDPGKAQVDSAEVKKVDPAKAQMDPEKAKAEAEAKAKAEAEAKAKAEAEATTILKARLATLKKKKKDIIKKLTDDATKLVTRTQELLSNRQTLSNPANIAKIDTEKEVLMNEFKKIQNDIQELKQNNDTNNESD
jgi:hypothetical protein